MTALRTRLLWLFVAALAPACADAGNSVVSAPVPPAKPLTETEIPGSSVFTFGELMNWPQATPEDGAALLDDEAGGLDGPLAGEDDDRERPGTGSGRVLEVGLGSLRTRITGGVTRRRDGLDLIAAGRELGRPRRARQRKGGASSGPGDSTDTVSGLANVWLDLPPSGRVTPYLGGGLGAARYARDGADRDAYGGVDETDFALAWQLGAGLAWDVVPHWAMTLDYRWFDMDAPDTAPAIDDGSDAGRGAHNLMAGMRLAF